MQIKLVWYAYKATSLSHVHTLQTFILFFKQSIFRSFQIYLNTLWRTCVYVLLCAAQARACFVRSQHIRRGLIMKISVDFCVYKVALCCEMVSSLKFNVWFQGHRMMNTTFWLWITTKKRYLIMMMATHNRKSFCCVLLSTQDNAYVASYSWVCSIDIVVVRSLI